MMTDDLHTLVLADAIGALDDLELSELHAQLAALSPSDQETIGQLYDTALIVAASADLQEPPPHIRDRVLAQTLINASPPDNLGFAQFRFDQVSAIQAQLEGAGFGFGRQGSSPGSFYTFPQPPMAPPIPITSNEPE